MKVFYSAIFVIIAIFFSTVSCDSNYESERKAIDSLNALSYNQKYVSLEDASKYVDEVFERYSSTSYVDGLSEAYINRGNIQGLLMNYDSAKVCYHKVLDNSSNDLLCGIADVGMMSVCLMTSHSKDFYDYRNDAVLRMANVEDEKEYMTPHQQLLWNAFCAEYHFVSYSYDVKMRKEEDIAGDIEWLDDNLDLFITDSAQYCTYLQIKSQYSVMNGRTDEARDEQRRNLHRLLAISKQKNYTYFLSTGLCSFSRSVLLSGDMRPSGIVYLEEMLKEKFDDDIPYYFAVRSLEYANQYGNYFIASNSLITLSDYYCHKGDYESALTELEHALQLINIHHKQANSPVAHETEVGSRHSVSGDTDDMLLPYSEHSDSLSLEMTWILSPGIVCVPDWMLAIREQLSIVYGAMGLKSESDYNHNIYFDILDATRQDQYVQQRQEKLSKEEGLLNILIIVFAVAIILLIWTLIYFYRKSSKKYLKNIDMLSSITDICEKMSGVFSEEIEDEEDFVQMLHAMTDSDVEKLFPQVKGKDWTKLDASTLPELDRELFSILVVYYEWMLQNGLKFITFSEEERKIDSDIYVSRKRFEDNKRMYIEKLTSMSIINGITPFLDRALHEVDVLKKGKDAVDSDINGRLQYLSELIDKINEFNDVLGHWVKIRKGIVTLTIENFSLQSLFDTLKRGAKSFDIKGVTLKIADTTSVVKADKSLTLFMMNTLLDNARKYTPKGGVVDLYAVENDEYVEISVKDTGHGMSQEDVDTLNNSKVYDSSKIGMSGKNSDDIKSNKGFGFGLMNCKGIIGKYKKTNALFDVCDFRVESKMGEGSRFYFRLPKGVLKTLSLLLLFIVTPLSMFALPANDDYNSEATVVVDSTYLDSAAYYNDMLFMSNVDHDFEQSLLYADTAIHYLNKFYLMQHPDGEYIMECNGTSMAEINLFKSGFVTDYNLIIALRNELAIAALSLNDSKLYRYNNEIFTRLYILTSQDTQLEKYCNDIMQANRNKKTLAVVLGLFMLGVVLVFFFMHYRHKQLFIFNIRQFIQLNKNVFLSNEQQLPKIFHESLSDIKSVDSVCVMLPSREEEDKYDFYLTGDDDEREIYEGLLKNAYQTKEKLIALNGHFHVYPLRVSDDEGSELIGVIGLYFHNARLSSDEQLIMNLVSHFLSIHLYFSYMKVGEMNELLELKADERLRTENEEQKIHIQNMIMDNCMSTIKHETMYYPNRIKQIVDAGLQAEDFSEKVNDINELMSYYKEIFMLLYSCAAKQVERVLFKRSVIPVSNIGDLTVKTFKKMAKKAGSQSAITIKNAGGLSIQGDMIFIQTLIDNVLSLFFEHNSGGNLIVNFENSDGFIKFAFKDTQYIYDEAEIPLLFYVDHMKYDSQNDKLIGAQYMLARQIIREHDAYSSQRGCRIFVQNDEDGEGSSFIFTLPAVNK
ncbi:MAG: DUF5113 domain-containing protein [Bacteroidaceae bacterium]|nr:DUF5113 domain-containing protein [Bacteroidaceae bacterium]